MKTLTRKIIAIILALSFALSLAGCDMLTGKPSQEPSDGPGQEPVPIENLILFIGDGMGYNHIANTKFFYRESKFIFESSPSCDIRTASMSSKVTDSAAAATALATGNKANNSEIGKSAGVDVTSISEIAKQSGKKVGIITTDYLHGATPSGFSAHATSRDAQAEIAATQSTSNIDLLIAKHDSSYHSSYANLYENNGYTMVVNDQNYADYKTEDKLVITFNDTSSTDNGGAKHYQLTTLLEFAIEYLDNENGFFLMIEGAYIDKYSHSNNIYGTVAEAKALFDAVEKAYKYIDGNKDTVALLTADHETGGLQKALTAEDFRSEDLYTSGNHTGVNVPLYVYNFDFADKGKLCENTMVFDLCRSILQI